MCLNCPGERVTPVLLVVTVDFDIDLRPTVTGVYLIMAKKHIPKTMLDAFTIHSFNNI